MYDDKPFYVSKTVIVNLIIAVCALIPSAKEFVSENPGTTLAFVSGLGVLLRLVTRGRIVLN